MPRITLYVTFRCSLKCKLCAAYAPYYEKPWHPAFETLCSQTDRLFDIISGVGVFSLSGGEPLVRKDIGGLIRHLDRYSKRIRRLELITNGTILPDEDVFSAFKEYSGDVKIIIDNYGPELSANAELFYQRAIQELAGVEVELRDYYSTGNLYCNGWVDYGGIGHFPERSDEDARKLFNRCALSQKLDLDCGMHDGILYSCCQARRRIELGYIPSDPKEVVDLFDSSYTDDEIQKRIKGFYSLKTISACKFCNGLCDDSIRYKPAEQL